MFQNKSKFSTNSKFKSHESKSMYFYNFQKKGKKKIIEFVRKVYTSYSNNWLCMFKNLFASSSLSWHLSFSTFEFQLFYCTFVFCYIWFLVCFDKYRRNSNERNKPWKIKSHRYIRYQLVVHILFGNIQYAHIIHWTGFSFCFDFSQFTFKWAAHHQYMHKYIIKFDSCKCI